MKLNICFCFCWLLFPGAHGQEEKFFNQDAMVSFEGLENVRDYLLQRNQRIYEELNLQYTHYKKTKTLRKGLRIEGDSFIVHSGSAPDLFQLEPGFTTMVKLLHIEGAESFTRMRLLNRGCSLEDLDALMKATSGVNGPDEYKQRHYAQATQRIKEAFEKLKPCSFAFDVLGFNYMVQVMSQLSMPARRAILAYIVEFRMRTAYRNHDSLCFSKNPKEILAVLQNVSIDEAWEGKAP